MRGGGDSERADRPQCQHRWVTEVEVAQPDAPYYFQVRQGAYLPLPWLDASTLRHAVIPAKVFCARCDLTGDVWARQQLQAAAKEEGQQI